MDQLSPMEHFVDIISDVYLELIDGNGLTFEKRLAIKKLLVTFLKPQCSKFIKNNTEYSTLLGSGHDGHPEFYELKNKFLATRQKMTYVFDFDFTLSVMHLFKKIYLAYDGIAFEIKQIFDMLERQMRVSIISSQTDHFTPAQKDYLLSFFGTPERLETLRNLFKRSKEKEIPIYILTRGCSFYVAEALKIAGLAEYVTAIGGFTCDYTHEKLFLQNENENFVNHGKVYQNKESEIIDLLMKNENVLYIDDGCEEHTKVLETLYGLKKNQQELSLGTYIQLGHSGSFLNNISTSGPLGYAAELKDRCIKVDNWCYESGGMTDEMIAFVTSLTKMQ